MSQGDESSISPQMRDYLMKEFGSIGDFAKQMSRHSPDMLEAWVKYRERVFEDSSKGLPKKYKELIGMAIEISTGRPSGKAGERHAKKAVQAGATLREVFDTAMLCEFFSGATNYVDYGLAAVRAAEEESKQRAGGK